jgi:hypothetical protein
MRADSPHRAEGRWVSASDLADFAYCPRSHYYRHHAPWAGPSPESVRSGEHGSRFHHRELTAVRSREDQAVHWAMVAAGSAVVLAVLVIGWFVGWWTV